MKRNLGILLIDAELIQERPEKIAEAFAVGGIVTIDVELRAYEGNDRHVVYAPCLPEIPIGQRLPVYVLEASRDEYGINMVQFVNAETDEKLLPITRL